MPQMNNPTDQQQVQATKQEYKRLREDDETIHNKALHRELLTSWRQSSPKMYLRLKKLGILNQTAYVAQQRMWAMSDDLEKQGMSVTDAREIAEKEHLMLEPETPEGQQENQDREA